MKVVIIGSKGFIGQHMINHFHGQGYDVWGADIFSDSPINNRQFIIESLNSDFTKVFESIRFDLCINCSGAASVPDSMVDPEKDYYLNTVNVLKILDSIRKFQPECKFINLSSAAVYGNPDYLPVKEDSYLKPLSPYGYHKLQAEEICKEFRHLFGLSTCSLRIFSVYGPGLRKQLFWDLYKKVKKGDRFVLYGTGNESRDFIYVEDLVKAVELVFKYSNFEGDNINVADGKEISIRDAVSDFLGFFECDIEYSFSGISRPGDPVRWLADISKLKSYGYKPAYDMKRGLREYFDWVSSTVGTEN
jgi:UDP-glucose 4-epimerase